MIDPLQLSGKIAASGLEAQSMRLRVVSENLANFDSTGKTPAPSPTRARPSASPTSWTSSSASIS